MLKFILITSLFLSDNGAIAQSSPFYQPRALINGKVTDTLSDRDIPTGQKGFAKDYKIKVTADDRLEIAVNSTAFDTVVTLLNAEGNAIAENDDGDVGSDSLLFVKIPKSGIYTVRVQSFGGSRGGKFTLTVTRLQPVPFSP
jgi:hypothetical protein